MIIAGDVIAECLEAQEHCDDPLIITPKPDIKTLREAGSASIDLRLGCWFLTLRQAKLTCIDVTQPSDHPETSEKFTKLSYVPFGQDFILHPRSFVLGATLEWIRIKRTLAGIVTGKSSWGRRGLIIATATGVHPGFTGCLTLEITNLGEIPLKIRPGMPICQLFLHRVESNLKNPDTSQFVGRRRPILGKINLDEISRRLSADS